MSGEIVREASELGLAPGEFPRHLTLDGVLYGAAVIARDFDSGDLLHVRYVGPDGSLVVLND